MSFTVNLLGSNAVTSASAASVSLTTTRTVTAGCPIFVAINVIALSSNVTSITDSTGANTYVRAVGDWSSDNTEAEIWYCINPVNLAAGSTITANFSPNALQYQYIAAVNVELIAAPTLDTAPSQNTYPAGTTTPSISTGVLAQAVEVVFGLWGGYANGAESFTESAGFTTISTGSSHGTIPGQQGAYIFSYKITNITTSVTYAPTCTNSLVSHIMVTSFRVSEDMPAIMAGMEDFTLPRRRTRMVPY